MTAAHRWPPLERRILETVPADPPGLDRAELIARLEVVPGNEWLVDEALEDLQSAGDLSTAEVEEGRSGFIRGSAPPKGV
jgi:hypothetical protein